MDDTQSVGRFPLYGPICFRCDRDKNTSNPWEPSLSFLLLPINPFQIFRHVHVSSREMSPSRPPYNPFWSGSRRLNSVFQKYSWSVCTLRPLTLPSRSFFSGKQFPCPGFPSSSQGLFLSMNHTTYRPVFLLFHNSLLRSFVPSQVSSSASLNKFN